MTNYMKAPFITGSGVIACGACLADSGAEGGAPTQAIKGASCHFCGCTFSYENVVPRGVGASYADR